MSAQSQTRPDDIVSEREPASTRLRRLRSLARMRRRIGWFILVLPLLMVVTADILVRGDRLVDLSAYYLASYGAAMVQSALMWGLLLCAASARRGLFRWVFALAFVFMATIVMGGQLYFHRQYATYINLDATLFGTSLSASLFGQLRADGQNFITSIVPPLILSVGLVLLGRRFIRPRPTVRRMAYFVAPLAVIGAFLIPCSYRTVQASTPDVIYLHAMGGLIQQLTGVRTRDQIKPGLRTPPSLPVLVAEPTTPRNVVFILSESLRYDAHCSVPAEDCPAAPEVNAAVPDRLPLTSLRSNSSTTAIQLAVLWSGLEPTESREHLHTAPLLFDYAHAAGMDTAYWTSHHMMFANSRLYVQDLPTKFQCGATDLDPLADIDLGARDDLLTERVLEELPLMQEPFFATVHYGNTHVPYLPDPDNAPFQPAINSKAPEDNEGFHNYYRNAVIRQDRTIADLIRFIRESDFSERTVIVFTADHGEAFREHDQLIHTSSVLEEQIHVPGWIDAPPGTLSDEERAAIESVRDQPIFHTDVTPTVLDLLGLWEEPQLSRHREPMVGQSWLRPHRPGTTLALTNCSGIWGCAFANWGMMRGTMKLEAREWDQSWHCYDVAEDPGEKNDLGPDACGDLVELADELYGGLPSSGAGQAEPHEH